MDNFYVTVAQLSFTLIGLWWAVVQFRHDEWIPEYRAMVRSVYLSFLVPGIMSLGALIDLQTRWVWQVTFVAAAVFGVVEMIQVIKLGDTEVLGRITRRLGNWTTVALYGAVGAVALLAEPISEIGDGDLKAIQIEAALITLMVFVGVNQAFDLLTAPKRQSRAGETEA